MSKKRGAICMTVTHTSVICEYRTAAPTEPGWKTAPIDHPHVHIYYTKARGVKAKAATLRYCAVVAVQDAGFRAGLCGDTGGSWRVTK